MNVESLYHHGIKGQKWGIRRYQNKDGTLTAEGKKHYDRREEKRRISELSDEELRRRVDRLQLEKRYFDLNRELRSDSTSAGKSYVTKLLSDIGEQQIKDLAKAGTRWAIKSALGISLSKKK